MYLKDLALTTQRKSKFSFGQNGIVPGILELYLSCLGKFNSKQFSKVIIEVVPPNSQFTISRMLSVIQITQEFSFEQYENSKVEAKRKLILDTVQSGLLTLSNIEKWDPSLLPVAYECCLSKKLLYRYLLRGKYFLSPNKKFYAAVYCCWEINQFEAYVIFYNKQKMELCRVRVMDSPYWKYEPFGDAKWTEDSETFCVYSKDKSTLWKASLNGSNNAAK